MPPTLVTAATSAPATWRAPASPRSWREARKAGRDLAGFEWLLYLYCSVRRDGDRARADVAGFLGRAYGAKPAAMLDRIAPAGTPAEVAARLQEYVDAGARHIVISPAAATETLAVVTLAAEEVLPRLVVRDKTT